MSSSQFFESNINCHDDRNTQKTDADLVVIYGKKGITFDQKGLENLIEEKTISSISVLRLTSPTPSMTEENDEEQLEIALRKTDMGSSSDSGNNSDNDDLSGVEDNEQHQSDEESDFNSNLSDSESSHDRNIETLKKKKRSMDIKKKEKRNECKSKNEKPELVGLKLEEFYTGQEARDVLRSAFKMAGVVPVKKTAEHDFLLYVIKNDHNYTPFTSPEQMKLKLDTDKATNKVRRISTNSPAKINIKKRLPQKMKNDVNIGDDKPQAQIFYSNAKTEIIPKLIGNKPTGSMKNSNDYIEEANTSRNTINGFHSIQIDKTNISLPNEISPTVTNKIVVRKKPEVIKIIPKLGFNGETFSIQPQTVKIVQIDKVTRTPKSANALQDDRRTKMISITKNLASVEYNPTPVSNLYQKPQSLPRILSVKNWKSCIAETTNTIVAPAESLAVKQIDLNKVMSNSKGVFTNIDSLLKEENKHKINVPLVSKTDNLVQVPKMKLKGFTPLVLENAINSQLPSQISIQSHQSSSEIVASNDQSELRDDQDILNARNKMDEIDNKKDDIPKQVKILEMTENVRVETKETTSIEKLSKETNLSGKELDELSEELLQKVVDLIEKDESEQETLTDDLFAKNNIIANLKLSSPPPLVPIIESTNESVSPAIDLKSSKSIIQIMTFNDHPIKQQQTLHLESPVIEASSKTDSVQIIRGNGRVITLPPIEAPTTRAKRRAQVEPTDQQRNSYIIKDPDPVHVSANTEPTVPDSEKKIERKNTTKGKVIAKENIKNKKRATTSRKSMETQTNKSRTGSGLSESEDDDDPKKLWCICRQPHNNRFMICCDLCEDWFHGTCVSVTKAMGKEMEQKKIDWKCPNCLQKQDDKKQPKISDMLQISNSSNSIPIQKEYDDAKEMTDGLEATIKRQNDLNEKDDGRKMENLIISTNFSLDADKSKTKGLKNEQGKYIPEKKQIHLDKFMANSLNIKMNTSSPQKEEKTKGVKNLKAEKADIQKCSNQDPLLKIFKPDKQHSKSALLFLCVYCKKGTKEGTIYCSDDCLNKYVRNILHQMQNPKSDFKSHINSVFESEKRKKIKGLFEDLLSMPDKKPKTERLSVIDRKSGKILTGHNAPSSTHLKKWLQENPTFEVIIPGSAEAFDIEKKLRSKQSTSKSSSNDLPLPSNKQQFLTNDAPICISLSTLKNVSPTVQKNSANFKEGDSSNSSQLIEQQIGNKIEILQRSEVKEGKSKSKFIEKQDDHLSVNKKQETEPIRSTVRRTLKEHLQSRINEHYDINKNKSKSSAEFLCLELREEDVRQFALEIDSFVQNLENEMFYYFNKNTGSKYRAKYRSLIFNLKDRKNLTLFKKICSKLVDATQLVRMSPEELASQELAQWRENETKHQLEIIKKSELESLNCNRNYVVKTHKGEEVIEEKLDDGKNTDLSLPLEQVAELFSNEKTVTSKSSSTKINEKATASASKIPIAEEDANHMEKLTKQKEYDLICASEEMLRNKTRAIENKSHKRIHDNDEGYGRSKSNEKRHMESYNSSHYKDRGFIKLKSNPEKGKNLPTSSVECSKSSDNFENTAEILSSGKKIHKHSLDAFNIVDKILESTKTVEEAANLVHGKILKTKQGQLSIASCSDQEPSNAVNLPPRDPYFRYYGTDSPSIGKDYVGKLWSRTIHMIDVTTFQTTIQPLSNNSYHINHLIPKELEVVGRIMSLTVWDYVSKIRKSPNKEIVLVRLIPSCEKDTPRYVELYQYLEHRNRLGVIRSDLPQIRDFYIYPLQAQKEMPSIFHPLENFDFFNDPDRPNVLIGILVRVHGKRKTTQKTLDMFSSTKFHSPTPDSPKRRKHSDFVYEENDYNIDDIIKGQIKTEKNTQFCNNTTFENCVESADEPYSPGEICHEEVKDNKNIASKTKSTADDDLKKRMEELNRQIAVQEMEIAGLLNVDGSSNVLSKISIPPDLSLILASIQSQKTIKPNLKTMGNTNNFETDDEEYDPESNFGTQNLVGQPTKSTSKLAQLTEAELLRMVPDDINIGSFNKEDIEEEPLPPGV